MIAKCKSSLCSQNQQLHEGVCDLQSPINANYTLMQAAVIITHTSYPITFSTAHISLQLCKMEIATSLLAKIDMEIK